MTDVSINAMLRKKIVQGLKEFKQAGHERKNFHLGLPKERKSHGDVSL